MTMQATTATTVRGSTTPKFTADEEIRLMDYPDSTEEIPLLDMSPYLRGEPGGRERVAERLKEITETIGFFYLSGHGIPQTLIDRVFAESRRFHALPAEVKDSIPWIDRDSHKTGYLGAGKERTERTNVNIIDNAKNLYSRFTIIREPDPSVETNVWPENLPGFKEVVLEYQGRRRGLGEAIPSPLVDGVEACRSTSSSRCSRSRTSRCRFCTIRRRRRLATGNMGSHRIPTIR